MPRLSEDDYKAVILDPLLRDRYGYPVEDLNRVHRNRTYLIYGGSYRPDYVFFVSGEPALIVEAKASERDFDFGREEATFHAKNYRVKNYRDTIVPFIMVAAGERIEMFHAKPAATGIGVEFVGLPTILSWEELNTAFADLLEPAAVEEANESAFAADQFTNIIHAVFEAIKSSGRPKYDDENAVFILNGLLLNTIYGRKRRYNKIIRNFSVPKKVVQGIEATLSQYDMEGVEGSAIAYAYRRFVARYFRGIGSTRQGRKDIERTGRYLTPDEVIDFMVRLAEPKPTDIIIDPACGSGGFLGGVLNRVPEEHRESFTLNNLYGCEIDPFCASAAYTFLELLLPGEHRDLNVFYHNGLYSGSWRDYGDISEFVSGGSFDIVIGNPPANAAYSGSGDFSVVSDALGLEDNFGDPEAFLARAAQLCRPGGRIILVVSDGILTNVDKRHSSVRRITQDEFQIRAVISLPRVFPYVSSKMSILYLKSVEGVEEGSPVFMASFDVGYDEDSGEESILGNELEAVMKEFREFDKAYG
jgi:SAM-dependent methyltransferase